MSRAYVNREYHSRKNLWEEVHEHYAEAGDKEPLPLEVKFIVSLLIDSFLKRLNPAIELKHLDIVEAFCGCTNSCISFLHVNLLHTSLPV